MPKTIEAFAEEVDKEIRDKQAHFDAHRDIIVELLKIAPLWSNQEDTFNSEPTRAADVNYCFGVGTINTASLNLILGKDDNISKDVLLFIEEHIQPLASRLGLIEKAPNEYDVNETLKWKKFEWRNGTKGLYVRAWFGKSEKCQLVGTGNFTEEMKVVCE